LTRPPQNHILLLGALLIGLVVRIPGVFWGINYPTGWVSHHGDEHTHINIAACLINPVVMADPAGHPGYRDGCPENYPRGMAAHVALPLIALRALGRKLSAPLPRPTAIFITGRLISVLYGVGTILVMYFFTRLFFGEFSAVPLLAAWILALCGFHVTQSHFFLADTAVLFWSLLGLYLLGLYVQQNGPAFPDYFSLAALCLGIAFGMKLAVQALPSLLVSASMYRPRVARLLYAAVFFSAGFCLVNMDAYSPYEVYKTLRSGSLAGVTGYHFSRLAGAGIYLLELPSLVSFPVTILGACGIVLLTKRLVKSHSGKLKCLALLLLVLPTVTALWFAVFKADNFPRHLLPIVPSIVIAAAWSLNWLAELLAIHRLPKGLAIFSVGLYLCLFVIDGERDFSRDPRNDAKRWLMENVATDTGVAWLGGSHSTFLAGDYTYREFPGSPPPELIVCEMEYANFFLSGMGWRNSYPRDTSTVFPMPGYTAATVPAWQSLFNGPSSYECAARFQEHYFMPEYVWTDRLIGNRSRNYVSEVIVFRHMDTTLIDRSGQSRDSCK
jgi:hypothetical protein